MCELKIKTHRYDFISSGVPYRLETYGSLAGFLAEHPTAIKVRAGELYENSTGTVWHEIRRY